MKETIHGIEEMYARAADFMRTLRPGAVATTIGLAGDLGAGKTRFVEGCARTFGITDPITSPTFVIEKIYSLKNQPFTHLIHIDAYRLQNAHELRILGFDEMLRNPGNIIFIEWPERVSKELPKNMHIITFSFVDEKTRKISFSSMVP